MPGRDADTVSALAAQAGRVMAVFEDAGYNRVAPEVLQPADLFFDQSGEEIRQRTFVFTSLDGEELCLRPDLTIPTCRLHLDLNGNGDGEARYCYLGSAFRFQPGGDTAANPREFQQAGLENFGASDKEAAEADVFALTLAAARAAGLKDFVVHLGDLGLFSALVDAIEMPARWRARLKRHFWRPQAFRRSLGEITGASGRSAEGVEATLLDALAGKQGSEAEQIVAETLELMGAPLVGGRSLQEITERLVGQAADRFEQPMPDSVAKVIEAYIAIEAAPHRAHEAIAALAGEARLEIGDALDRFARRLTLMAEAGLDADAAVFSAEFGRNLEYYTGLVFQFELPGRGKAGRIAGGGRYDTLLQAIGADQPVPAVGTAIHTERLLGAVRAAS